MHTHNIRYIHCLHCLLLHVHNKAIHASYVGIIILMYVSVYVLCKLIGGEFPVTHCSDYVNPSDKKALSVNKPKLIMTIPRRIRIKVTVKVSCQEVFVALRRSMSSSVHFEVIFSGIEFPSSHLQRKYLRHFSALLLDEFFINPRGDEFDSYFSLPKLNSYGTLWMNTDSNLPEKFYREFDSHLHNEVLLCMSPMKLIVTQFCNNVLLALMNENININSFCVLAINQPSFKNITDSINILDKFLQFNMTVLEYLHMRSFFLSMLPLQSLQKCVGLRVLSVTMNLSVSDYFKRTATAIEIFSSLRHLRNLEYLEWSEPLNIVTRDILVLFDLLSNYLPNLIHWHWKLNYLLLFTTDLNDSDFKPLEGLLNVLLAGKTGTSTCSTYKFSADNLHFKNWLEAIRPQTCFCNVSFPRDSQLHFSTL